MSMFKTHENHLPEIVGAIQKHGEVYFHGDGNIYHKDSPIKSDDAIKYAQRLPGRAGGPGPGSYRVKFTNVSKVPGTLEGLNDMLLKGMALQLEEAATPKANKQDAFALGKVEYKTAFPGQTTAAPVVKEDSAEVKLLKEQLATARKEKEEIGVSAGQYIEAGRSDSEKLRAELDSIKAEKDALLKEKAELSAKLAEPVKAEPISEVTKPAEAVKEEIKKGK